MIRNCGIFAPGDVPQFVPNTFPTWSDASMVETWDGRDTVFTSACSKSQPLASRHTDNAEPE